MAKSAIYQATNGDYIEVTCIGGKYHAYNLGSNFFIMQPLEYDKDFSKKNELVRHLKERLGKLTYIPNLEEIILYQDIETFLDVTEISIDIVPHGGCEETPIKAKDIPVGAKLPGMIGARSFIRYWKGQHAIFHDPMTHTYYYLRKL